MNLWLINADYRLTGHMEPAAIIWRLDRSVAVLRS
jgi:hypothetical protein